MTERRILSPSECRALVGTSSLMKPKGVSDTEWAERQAALKAKSLVKLRNRIDKSKRRDAKPKDYDPERHRWNPAKGRFEVDRLVLLREQWAEEERRAASPLVEMRATVAGVTVEKIKRTSRKVAIDSPITKGSELATSVAVYNTRDKLAAFAKANGCWDDKYDKLPNPGLIRMNVLNRLRAKIRKGHKVIWN